MRFIVNQYSKTMRRHTIQTTLICLMIASVAIIAPLADAGRPAVYVVGENGYFGLDSDGDIHYVLTSDGFRLYAVPTTATAAVTTAITVADMSIPSITSITTSTTKSNTSGGARSRRNTTRSRRSITSITTNTTRSTASAITTTIDDRTKYIITSDSSYRRGSDVIIMSLRFQN